jgi:hypothetical protein
VEDSPASNSRTRRERRGMSRHSGMTPQQRRAWGIGLVVFFAVMCGMIAWSQWYAVHHNVPYYEHKATHEH